MILNYQNKKVHFNRYKRCCGDKKRFESTLAAITAAREIKYKDDRGNLEVYECSLKVGGRHYHIGHKTDKHKDLVVWRS